MIRTFALFALALGLAGSTATATAPPCRWTIPIDVTQRPVRWLGSCKAGLAEGTGILRAGVGEPYDFFLGRMSGGRPVDGIIVAHGTEWLAAYGFDARGGIRPAPSANGQQFEALFGQAAAAAEATARSMDGAGNRQSARYYRTLAQKVRRALPE
ncbi:MAG: hypothetical protein EOO77_21200 [Oxalobacteraceae bacterium]|nr:MAG: hypothetical protein EOO77_21200 [Oxalobacteraceae bacterium]